MEINNTELLNLSKLDSMFDEELENEDGVFSNHDITVLMNQ